MSTNTPRTVRVESFEKIPGTKDWHMVDKGLAVFHGFSMDHEDYESGPGHFPVAIVEFPDGHIETHRVERIKFIKPEAAQ